MPGKKPVKPVTADELSAIMSKEKLNVLDDRKNNEYLSEHIIDAESAPLDFINESMIQVDKNKTYYVHCTSGYRSMIFNSVLKARGYHNLIDVKDGFKAVKESGKFQLTDFVCPTSLL
jgi:rhodanese-related sulfurtransferase